MKLSLTIQHRNGAIETHQLHDHVNDSLWDDIDAILIQPKHETKKHQPRRNPKPRAKKARR